MSQTKPGEPNDPHEDERPRMRAVVGSDRIEEEIFGRVFDGKVTQRIWQFVRPYKRNVVISVAAVVAFTGSQLTIPLLIRYAIDTGMAPDAPPTILLGIVALFAVIVVINFVASCVQELVTGRMAENVLFDICNVCHCHSWTKPKSAG
jgi:ATP-binding cassette subfamily B multidrug efflux pump